MTPPPDPPDATAGLVLAEAPDGALPCLLPPDRAPDSWHAAITAEISAGLGPAHASLLAAPRRGSAGLAWVASGTAMRRLTDFAEPDRRHLIRVAGAILSDIRRLAESGQAVALRAAWPALREIPDLGYLFAVDGRPVLAGWGHGRFGGGAFARFDDGIPWRPEPQMPWRTYGAAALALGGLALGAGLLLPWLGLPFGPQVSCRLAPGQLDLLDEAQREAARGVGLRRDIALLDDQQGTRALQCPLRTQPPPPPTPVPRPSPRPLPVPPPTPPPHHDDQLVVPSPTHDMAFLQGCWQTDHFRHSADETGGVSTYCFDAQGHGTFTYRSRGYTCRSAADGRFAGDALRLDDRDTRCSDGSDWFADHLTCHPGAGGVAICSGEGQNGVGENHWRVNLHRVGPARPAPGGPAR